MKYESFTEMPVWKKAFQLMLKIYQITKTFPADERFGLISEMRRSANSIVHNIAEGFGRFYPKEKSQFYRISRGSSYELWSQILASQALGYITLDSQKELICQCQEVIEECLVRLTNHPKVLVKRTKRVRSIDEEPINLTKALYSAEPSFDFR